MYTFESRVRYSEVGPDKMLTTESVIDYLQDCSTFQSEELGIGLDYLGEQHLAWFLNFWQIEFYRYPKLNEKITVGTSPYELRSFMGLRNFMIEAEDGERLVNANSVWSLINMDKMMPVRIPQLIYDKYELFEKFPDMIYEPRKISLPKQGGKVCPAITIREYHLDTNHHVNNGQYVRFAAGMLPEDARITQLLVEYRKQALLGDEMIPVCYDADAAENDGRKMRYVALTASDGSVYAAVRFTYINVRETK